MMLIFWFSTIFIVLMPSGFILVHSRALPSTRTMNYQENQQWTDNVIDSLIDGTRGGEPSESSFEATRPSVKSRKIPVHLDRQEMTVRKRHQHDNARGISSEKENYQKKKYTLAVLKANIQARKNFTTQRWKKIWMPDGTRGKFIQLRENNSVGNTVENITVTSSNRTENNSAGNTVENITVTSSQVSSNDASNRASNNSSKQQSIHCQVIEDIYITDINEKVPSYSCKLGNNTFFLSSKRFSQEHRNSLDVTVDDDTFHRLINDSFASTENGHVIEVVLTLRSDGKNYEIHHNRRAEL